MSDLSVFDEHFRQWAYAAAATWGQPPPTIEWFEEAHVHLPVGLRTELGRGIDADVVRTVDGHQFSLPGGAGPYAWFRQADDPTSPIPVWSTYVQVAEYLRISSLVEGTDLAVAFEDDDMGITVRRGSDLLWHLEARETFSEAYELSRHLDRYGVGGVDHDADHRRDRALAIAKVILGRRPLYFSVVGIGGRLDFSVAIHDTHHYDLIPDLVPVGSQP